MSKIKEKIEAFLGEKKLTFDQKKWDLPTVRKRFENLSKETGLSLIFKNQTPLLKGKYLGKKVIIRPQNNEKEVTEIVINGKKHEIKMGFLKGAKKIKLELDKLIKEKQ